MFYYLLFSLYLMSLLLIPAVIMRKKEPVSSLAWIIAIIFLPLIGAFFYLLFGTDRIKNEAKKKSVFNREIRKRLQSIEAGWALKDLPKKKRELPESIVNIMRVSAELGPFGAVEGNSFEILVNAEEAFPRMKEAILSAKDHINLESYIYNPDDTGAEFADLLARKARQGVKVHLLYDAVGSIRFGWSRSLLGKLRSAGVKVKDFLPLHTIFFKPWNANLRNHRKILVVDGKIGFTGGLGIGDDFLNDKSSDGWRDTHVMFQGPAVDQLQWVFCEDWDFATGEELFTEDYFPPIEINGNKTAQIVPCGPDEVLDPIHKVFVAAISQSKKSVYLTTPYFIPDKAIYVALQLAALRGVDVKLLLPRKSDHRFVLLAGRSYYEELLQSGIRIFEYVPSILHAKMFVVDSSFVIIGSANMDIRSFDYDFEANAQVYDDEFAKKAEKVFFSDLEKSREVSLSEVLDRPPSVRFKENLCRLLSSLL
ncbi:MAG TPA: cardiolipin synthase [Thermodesulfobacteriota bacterium]|nr:cardiolipin synthase [Thermodesulfobacteriota bacterium]